MSAKKKRQDSLKAKEKKQKIIAAVGGVLLLGLLAFQVPRVMKQMNRGQASAAAVPQTVSTPATTPSLEAPTTLGQGSGTSTSSSGSDPTGSSSSGLITSASGAATEGQLASFSRFESKDPFSQQVKPSSSGSDVSTSGSSSGSGSAGGTTGGSGGSGSAPTGAQPAPTSAVISVNGTLMTVSTGTDFPQPSASDPTATPVFHLVSLTKTTAKISIAGGSYTSGAATVTLRVNKVVTLMNTADGSKFKLILKPQGTPVPGEGGTGTTGTGTTPTVTLPAPSP
jgi:hypothetical protein